MVYAKHCVFPNEPTRIYPSMRPSLPHHTTAAHDSGTSSFSSVGILYPCVITLSIVRSGRPEIESHNSSAEILTFVRQCREARVCVALQIC